MLLLRKRRWLTFSVRTLLFAVTVFCVWLGWQVSIVRERKALREWAADHGSFVDSTPINATGWGVVHMREYRVPWYREMLGDKPVTRFVVPGVWRDEEQVKGLERYYPEADVFLR